MKIQVPMDTYINSVTKKPLVIVAGPTAVGKSAFAVELAKTIGGEIISADSMQVYRRMDIGSAKIMPEEMDGVPHHLIDILEPTEPFDVALFTQLAGEAIDEITSRGNIPVLVGGTGFYIQAVRYGIDFQDGENDPEIRRRLEQTAAEKGAAYMHGLLQEADPESAAIIHENNIKRVIRALEYKEITGEKISDHNARQHEKVSPYNSVLFCLTDEREKMYERIDVRVDKMIEQGLVDEVRGLKDEGCHRGITSMQGLGYKEILDYLDGLCSLEQAVYLIKRDTRHFAKRQLTWMRRERDVTWLDRRELPDTKAMLEQALSELKERHILQ